MNIAFCYESVLPTRGGCATEIANLARRLVADGHDVHVYACRWDKGALPAATHYHPVHLPPSPRFLRPWRFGAACLRALKHADHDVTMGFDKTWGLDVLYPQGGLYVANADYNLLKYPEPLKRRLLRALKYIDPAHLSFSLLERRQYLGKKRSIIVAISEMVRDHFQHYYGIASTDLRLVRIAADQHKFDEHDRPRRRLEWRQHWGIHAEENVALFVGMNYRLKGLDPLLHAVKLLPREKPFRLLVAGNARTAEFEETARRLGVAERVRFVGYREDIVNCYFASDFLVHPTFYDPCSHVVLEAMTCGLPVITTRYNGASELLHPPREGFVIADPHDHGHLAWCLTQFLDAGRRSLCAQAARRISAQWTFEHHYRQLLDVFNEAMARKKAA
jgi:UDP-glucose:(heptosyl)LPS alpha-1,3-glucosyltransferase